MGLKGKWPEDFILFLYPVSSFIAYVCDYMGIYTGGESLKTLNLYGKSATSLQIKQMICFKTSNVKSLSLKV